MAPRPIVFTVDNRYIRPLAVALASLEQHAAGPREVIVAHERLHPLHRRLLRHRFRHSPLRLSFLRLPLPVRRRRQPHHFSPAILLRLLLAQALDAPSFLYVDADVLFCADPARLDRIDLEGCSLAAAAWDRPRDLRSSGHGILPRYFASSLLLIHRERFLAERVGERALALIEAQRLEFPDQDALNLCCPSWQPLPPGLCMEIADIGPPLQQPPNGALLLQCSGSEKPWQPFNRHPCRLLFQRQLQRTPYRLLPPGPADLRWRSLGSRLRQRLLVSVRSRRRSTSS